MDRLSGFIAFGVRLISQPLNYSGIIAGLTSDVFGLRKQMSGPLSLFSPSQSRHSPPSPSSFPSLLPELSDATARSETLSAQCIEPLTCASEIVPDPTRAVVTVGSGSSPNVYKTSPFYYLDFLAILFAIVRLRSEGRYTPKSTHLLYIASLTLDQIPNF